MNKARYPILLRLAALMIALCLAISPLLAYAEGTAYRKQDISEATITIEDYVYCGNPFEGEHDGATVMLNGEILTPWEDYSILLNTHSIGTATALVVGQGNYYGHVIKEFQVSYGDTTVQLLGDYNGNISGELNDESYTKILRVSPGIVRGVIGTSSEQTVKPHVAYCALYTILEGKDGNKWNFIDEIETTEYAAETQFIFDFSAVYDVPEYQTLQYVLAYSWLDVDGDIYSGFIHLRIPTKRDPATQLFTYVLPNCHYREFYLFTVSNDGSFGEATWTVSDPSVATIDKDGVMTWLKPGTVTITTQSGELIDTTEPLTMDALDITQGVIDVFSVADQTAEVVHDGFVLIPETDYTMTVTETDGITEVTVTGCGLFTGQLVRQYNTTTGEALGHSHGFTDSCDETCGSCDFTRTDTHKFSDQWIKDPTSHWHACTACGAKTDEAEHTLSPEDSEVCTVCGTLYIPGDIDCNMLVNRDDVVQLLLHVSMPSAFPIEVSADFTGDNIVNRDDVVQLLLHVSMPDAFPLSA